jgi:hypothetical protein
VCKIDEAFDIVELTTAISGTEPTKVGVPQVAIDGSATKSYGWVAVEGPLNVDVNGTPAAGTQLTTHTVAGQASTGGDVIHGLTNSEVGQNGITECFATAPLATNT